MLWNQVSLAISSKFMSKIFFQVIFRTKTITMEQEIKKVVWNNLKMKILAQDIHISLRNNFLKKLVTADYIKKWESKKKQIFKYQSIFKMTKIFCKAHIQKHSMYSLINTKTRLSAN